MRSLIRYTLVAVGALALMTIGVVTLRTRLEQKAKAQTTVGCNKAAAPSMTNLCLIISSFRENGPGATTTHANDDEFFEVFNLSSVASVISATSGTPTSNDPNTTRGIGIFVSAGEGTTLNQAKLACEIPGGTVIPGRGWYLCGGVGYTLGTLGNNNGTFFSVPDTTIGPTGLGPGLVPGTSNASVTNVPDDSGAALLSVGGDIVTQCLTGSFACPTGFNFSEGPTSGNAVVLDSVGFNPYGQGSPVNNGGVYPGNLYPSLASQYCQGTCLQPVGDASTQPTNAGQSCPPAITPLNPNYPNVSANAGNQNAATAFPVKQQGFATGPGGPTTVPLCYGESGQYKIEARRAGSGFNTTAGDLYVKTGNNAFDYILDAPDPITSQLGIAVTGVPGISSVLGAAGPHNSSAAPLVGSGILGLAPFDIGGFLAPRNAERKYAMDAAILGEGNDPLGTFILRIRYTYLSSGGSPAPPLTGLRLRVDDITTLCGGQQGFTIGSSWIGNTSTTATQEARNLRGPNASIPPATTPTPTCQGEGSDSGVFSAILKAVNSGGRLVIDSGSVVRRVYGTTLDDVASAAPVGYATPRTAPTLAPGSLQPFGGGSDSSYTLNAFIQPFDPTATEIGVGDGVNCLNGANCSPAISNFTIPSFFTAGSNTIPGVSSAAPASLGDVLRLQVRFGVVRSGRFKVLLGTEVAGPTPVP